MCFKKMNQILIVDTKVRTIVQGIEFIICRYINRSKHKLIQIAVISALVRLRIHTSDTTRDQLAEQILSVNGRNYPAERIQPELCLLTSIQNCQKIVGEHRKHFSQCPTGSLTKCHSNNLQVIFSSCVSKCNPHELDFK